MFLEGLKIMQHLILSQVDGILVTGGDSRNFVIRFPVAIRTDSGIIQRSFFQWQISEAGGLEDAVPQRLH